MSFRRSGNGHDHVLGCIGSVRREHAIGGHLEGGDASEHSRHRLEGDPPAERIERK